MRIAATTDLSADAPSPDPESALGLPRRSCLPRRSLLPRGLLALAALLASSFGFASGALAQSGAKLTPPVIGIVDVRAAIEQYPRFIQITKDLESSANQYRDRLDQLMGQLDELRATISVLADDASDERRTKEFELQMGLQRHDFLRKSFRDRMAFEELRGNLRVYEDLEVAVAKVARARGVDIVLRREDIKPAGPDIDKMAARELQDRYNAYRSRSLIFASERLDLTGDVIKLLQVPLEQGGARATQDGATQDGAKQDGAKPTPGGGG